MRKLLVVAILATVVVTPVAAQTYYGPGPGPDYGLGGPGYAYDPEVTGSIRVVPGYGPSAIEMVPPGYGPGFAFPDDSAASSNAEALTRPQQNYGQNSGGYLD